jgi:ankyrin repeat protein
MKNNRNFIKSIIRVTFFTILVILFSISGTRAQTCNKTSLEKPLKEKMADYALNGPLDKIRTMIEENNFPVDQRLLNEETMLTLAAWGGKYDIAEYLINKKANVNCRNDWQNTPLHNAAQKGYDDIIRLLLSSGANINARGTDGNTAINFAARYGHPKTLILLQKEGSNVNSKNDYNQTPLLQVSWDGNADIIRFLVENGADLNEVTSDRSTALHNMASQGNLEAIRIMLEHGADVNKVNSDGRLPLHNALISKKPEAVQLLLSKTQNINLQENCLGNTPLHIAAINGDLKSTELLIKSGAKTDILNKMKKTPVDYAVKYGYLDIVNFYVSNSGAPKVMINTARENQTSGLVNLNNGSAKVIYCGHSGWAVQTGKHLLIFDYMKMNVPDQPGLANGTINPNEIKDKDVIVFVSHDHEDHYDTSIYEWAKTIKKITYIYGFKPNETWDHREKGYFGPKYVYINDDQTRQIDNVSITTLKSNDSGQGFLVTADGVTIYHPGDLAWFSAEDETVFKKEVDFIASLAKPVDVAFLPVTGCPSRWKKEFIVQGFFYTIDKLNPVKVFPMHALHREYTMKEFAELAEKRMIKNQVVCVENTGDNFQYQNNMISSK